MSNPNCTVELTQGRRYFFRASCGNLKGYGAFFTSIPSSVVPSTWRKIDQKEPRFGTKKGYRRKNSIYIFFRFSNRLKQLEQLMDEVKQVRPGSEILEMQGPQRRPQRKKTTIKQLFTAASKFQKNLRRYV